MIIDNNYTIRDISRERLEKELNPEKKIEGNFLLNYTPSLRGEWQFVESIILLKLEN